MPKIVMYCVECTTEERKRDKYRIVDFRSLTAAFEHLSQHGWEKHEIKIELEPDYDEE